MKSIKLLTLAIAGLFITSFSFAQTADEIVNKHIEAIGGKENWKKITSMRSEATLSTQGIEIPVIISQVHNKGVKQEFSVMGMSGYSIISVDGGWNFNPMAGQEKPEPMTQDELNIGKEQLDIQGEMLDYKQKGHTVELQGNEDIDGVSCFKLKLTRKSGRESVYIIDPKSFYIVRMSSKVTANGQEVESKVNLSNYQKLPAGIFIPFTMENNALPAPITITKVEVNIPIADTIFKVQQ
jgi:outer membrane lipoprotein-sorting protein